MAGAGTGKTRVIVHRIAYLIATGHVNPERLVAVTFTNRAAEELRSRVSDLVGPSAAAINVGTFHWLGHRFLRRYGALAEFGSGFKLLSPRESSLVLRNLARSLDLGPVPPPPIELREAVSAYRNAGRTRNFGNVSVADIARAYERRVHAQGALDLDDLVLQPVRILAENAELRARIHRRFEHVLVDEYQDVNLPQRDLVQLIGGQTGRVTAVGDEDQSIYTWRQADASVMLHFEEHFPEATTLRLEQNYRSTKRILRASNALVLNNRMRLGKKLFTEGDSGKLPVVFAAGDESEEANFVADSIVDLTRQGVPASDIGILYRMNAQSRVLEEALVRRAVPYSIRGGRRFYDRPEVARIIDGLRLIAEPEDPAAWKRFLPSLPGIAERRAASIVEGATQDNVFAWTRLATVSERSSAQATASVERVVAGIPSMATAPDIVSQVRWLAQLFDELGGTNHVTTLDADAEAANVEEFVSVAAEFSDDHRGNLADFLDRLSLREPGEAGSGVQLMTLHAAKGLEFDCAFITGVEEGLIPHSRAAASSTEGLEEERRLLYVGMTRARRALFLSYSHARMVGGRHGPTGPSRFLQEIPRQLVEVSQSPKQGQRMRLHRVSVGEHVRHQRWGKGTVERVHGKGHGTMVLIAFEDGTRQTVQLCHAPLQRVSKGAP